MSIDREEWIWIYRFDRKAVSGTGNAQEQVCAEFRIMVDRLKTLSSSDMLTGVQNRNEMNIYVEQLGSRPENENKPVGIVFADLNGLKVVNDEEGHFAGDDLLKTAAKVKEIQKKYDRVSFSIGCAVRPECAQVREALKVADALMYEDKRNYYARHPEKKRRTVLA